jgi:hypothetical protein
MYFFYYFYYKLNIMKNLLCLLSISLLLFACNSGSKQSSKSLEQKKVAKLLSENSIFMDDSVKFYTSKANRDQITKAKMLFYQGLDMLVNKKNAAEGIKLFKESALYNPDGKTYYYLANAFIDNGDTSNVSKALYLASQLGYEQQDEITYTYARMSGLLGDTATAFDQLNGAFQMGFVNKKRIETDRCFDKIRNLEAFEAIMISNFKDEVTLKAKLFKSFLAEFPDASFPMEIQKDSISYTENIRAINYDFASFIIGMEDGRFSRDVTNEYLMVGKFKTDKNINAVIYKTITAIVDTLQPVEIKIATYDSLGNVLAELTIGNFEVPATLALGSIDTNGIITVKHYTIKWKTDPTENGYAGNQRMGEDLVSENKYKIDEKGQFIGYTPDVVTKQ